MTTLSQKIKGIIKHYPYINNQRFIYKTGSDLTRKFRKITLFILLEDEGGVTVFKIHYSRYEKRNAKQWGDYLSMVTPAIGKERGDARKKGFNKPGLQILEDNIIEGINNKHRLNWQYKDLIAWRIAQ